MGVRHLMLWNYKTVANYKTVFILIGIFLLAFFLRIININISPPGFTWDEASWGYNAYSILKTGKDEYGNFLPLIFKAFGDYKFGVYIYLTVPFVAIFGLTETATRLPAIIAGSFIPVVAYLVAGQILPQNKKRAGFLIALLLCFSPWAMQYSRGAWEAMVSLLWILLGTYFFLRAREGKKTYLVIAIILFSLTVYTYQSAKIFSTLLILGLLFIYKDQFLKKSSGGSIFVLVRKNVFLISLVGMFFIILASSFANRDALSRLVVLNQFSYQRSETEIGAIKHEDEQISLAMFTFFHSEVLEHIRTVTGRYLNYFSPQFLFIQGGADGRQGPLDYGMMHLFEFPFLLIGLYFLLRLSTSQRMTILLWFVLAPIAASLSRDVVNTDRALQLVFPLAFVVGLGMYEFFRRFNKKLYLGLAVSLLLLIAIFNIGYFFDRLFIHSRIHASDDFLYGHKQVVEYIQKNKDKYNKIVFTTKFNEPYIFYLFYSKYDPTSFQKQAVLIQNSADVGEVPKIDNIEFRPLYWPHDRSEKNNLYIGSWLEIPDQDIDPKQSQLLQTIYFLDGTIAFKIAETKP